MYGNRPSTYNALGLVLPLSSMELLSSPPSSPPHSSSPLRTPLSLDGSWTPTARLYLPPSSPLRTSSLLPPSSPFRPSSPLPSSSPVPSSSSQASYSPLQHRSPPQPPSPLPPSLSPVSRSSSPLSPSSLLSTTSALDGLSCSSILPLPRSSPFPSPPAPVTQTPKPVRASTVLHRNHRSSRIKSSSSFSTSSEAVTPTKFHQGVKRVLPFGDAGPLDDAQWRDSHCDLPFVCDAISDTEDDVDDSLDQADSGEISHPFTEEDLENLLRLGEGFRHSHQIPHPRQNTFYHFGAPRLMVLVDTSGVHQLPVVFCTCKGAPPPHLQLLRMGLYPATTERPQTAFTFRVLDDFLLTNKTCKLSCMTYFAKLRRVTNNACPYLVPVRVFRVAV